MPLRCSTHASDANYLGTEFFMTGKWGGNWVGGFGLGSRISRPVNVGASEPSADLLVDTSCANTCPGEGRRRGGAPKYLERCLPNLRSGLTESASDGMNAATLFSGTSFSTPTATFVLDFVRLYLEGE